MKLCEFPHLGFATEPLFALQSKAKEDHQKFLVEGATLIKSSYTQLNNAVWMTSRAEKAALDSAEFSKQLNEVAHAAYDGLRF